MKLDKIELLNELLDQERHYLYRYSVDVLMSEPMPGYDERWSYTRAKIEALEEIMKIIETVTNADDLVAAAAALAAEALDKLRELQRVTK